MNPSQLALRLRKIAGMVDRSEAPSVAAVAAELASVAAELEDTPPGREVQAAKLKKFMGDDFAEALGGLDGLINSMDKVSRTLNPQDEAKATIEDGLTAIHKLRNALAKAIQELEPVNV